MNLRPTETAGKLVERIRSERRALGACPDCGRSHPGQGSAYFGPACRTDCVELRARSVGYKKPLEK